jgi:hypothetical protein
MTYPDPHYDEDDTCTCPDHRAMRQAQADELAELTGERPKMEPLVRQAIGDTKPRRALRTVITGIPDELMRKPPKEPISVMFIRIDYTLGIAYYMYVDTEKG